MTAVQAGAAPRGTRWTRLRRQAVVLVEDVALAGGLCALILLYVAQPFTVEGTSMLPTLENGQRIIVNKLAYRFGDIERNDIVVFYYPLDPDKSFIKRVIGLPGDTVEIRDGNVYLNGTKLNEPYVVRRYRDRDDYSEMVVQPGHYFVLGDHRNGSNDSRSGWLVPQRYIYGRAFFRYWPPSRFGTLGP